MARETHRPRIPPTWRAGLRRGKIRNETTLALERCPEMKARLMNILAELDAMGFEPVSMEGVRQPFDYEPRVIPRAANRIH